jgi:cobaltochelatase CobT
MILSNIDYLIKTAKTLALNNELNLDILVENKNITIIRGEADYQAFRDKYHSLKTQMLIYDEEEIKGSNDARNILNKCEWARIQAIGCAKYKGVRTNLNMALEIYCLNQGYSYIKDFFSINIEEVIGIYIRSRLTQNSLPKSLQGLYQQLPLQFKETIDRFIIELNINLYNQYQFAVTCIKLIKELNILSEKQPSDNKAKTLGEPEIERSNRQGEIDKAPSELQEKTIDVLEQKEQPPLGQSSMITRYNLLSFSFPEKLPYKIFTTEYDEVVHASKLSTYQEKEQLKHIFIRKSKPYISQALTHAKALAKLLQGKQKARWRYNQERGILDSRRIAKLVLGESQNLFKEYELVQAPDTAVSLLVDNSGSMRGKHIVIAALCAKILMNILEKNRVKAEVLGFTTKDWRGGQAYKKWQALGSPANPGRLNDLRHIIYKSFNENLIKAQSSLNIMLKESLLKENIDGEALKWACKRLTHQPQQRRILVVISDGAPVDDMTLKHNSKDLLEDHLKLVIHSVEKAKKVELIAIGIGHDVSKFYTNSIKITDSESLAKELFSNLIKIFSKKKYNRNI